MNFSSDDEKNIKEFATFLLNLSPNEFAGLSVAIGFLFSQVLDPYAQQSAGNFFECLGQVMLTISSQAFTRQNKDHNTPF